MATAQHTLQVKHSQQPDEVRRFVDRGHMDIVHLSCGDAGVGDYEPGWRWSECVKPIVGTDSCQTHHVGYMMSGGMTVVMDDGERQDIGAGDFFDIPPGHDAWVVGEETCRMVDFGGLAGYAKPH